MPAPRWAVWVLYIHHRPRAPGHLAPPCDLLRCGDIESNPGPQGPPGPSGAGAADARRGFLDALMRYPLQGQWHWRDLPLVTGGPCGGRTDSAPVFLGLFFCCLGCGLTLTARTLAPLGTHGVLASHPASLVGPEPGTMVRGVWSGCPVGGSPVSGTRGRTTIVWRCGGKPGATARALGAPPRRGTGPIWPALGNHGCGPRTLRGGGGSLILNGHARPTETDGEAPHGPPASRPTGIPGPAASLGLRGGGRWSGPGPSVAAPAASSGGVGLWE